MKKKTNEIYYLNCEKAELEKKVNEQEAEIKRLKREISKLKDDNCHDYHCMCLAQEEAKELKAEIERLTAEIDQRREMMNRMNCNYATELQKNAELQKQVDELTEFKKEVFSLGLYKLGLSDGVNSFAERLKEEVNGDINRIYALGCGAVAPLCRFIEQIDEIAKEITEGKK